MKIRRFLKRENGNFGLVEGIIVTAILVGAGLLLKNGVRSATNTFNTNTGQWVEDSNHA
jgi:hypothetical protein